MSGQEQGPQEVKRWMKPLLMTTKELKRRREEERSIKLKWCG